MIEQDVLKKIEWNLFLLELKEFGTGFIDNDLVDKIAARTGNGHTIIHRQVGANIPEWIHAGLKCKPFILQVFASQPHSVGTVHKDGLERKSTLNIPICNCIDGQTEWFEDVYKEIKISNEYTQIRLIDGVFDSEPALAVNINEPCILNTDVWHRVNNINEHYRYVLSIRFADNPSYADLISKDLFYV